MHAMILAAGRGERMRPLTDATPKPLLRAGGKTLIEWQIEGLAAGGFTDLVVNHAWLGARIEDHLGDGQRYGVRIRYSREGEALETLGGIVRALPLLGDAPFAVVSADIHTDYPYARLAGAVDRIAAGYPRQVAHFVLTDNPTYHPEGDIALDGDVVSGTGERLTYANIGVFHPRLFEGLPAGQKLKLFPWAWQFLEGQHISGEHYGGAWDNVGTPQQLAELDARLAARR